MTSPAPKAARPLGLAACIALVMGNMIGSGVFVLPAALAPYGWNAVAGWIITISGALALAWVIARLTIRLPDAKGPPAMIARAFGPWAGFAIGWVYWVSIVTANTTIAVAVVANLTPLVPVLGQVPFAGVGAALAILWSLTLLNLRGAQVAGSLQLVTLILKLVPMVVVVVLIVLALGNRSAVVAPFPTEGLTLPAVTASAALTLWALLGFESASAAADKVADPTRTIPRATIIGTAATGAIYLFVCSGIALLLPMAEAQSASPFAAFVTRYWAPGPANLIALFASISCLGALNGWTLLQGEVPLAMARNGELPAWLGVTDVRGTPVRALVVSSVFASLLLIANSLNGLVAIFTAMALLSTSATLWLYLGCAAAALHFRVAIPAAILGLLYALWTLWGAGPSVSGLSLVLMLVGFPLFWWTRRKRDAND